MPVVMVVGGHVVPGMRQLKVGGAALVAVCALAGCAPAGYNAGAYGGSSNAGYPAGDGASTPPDASADDTASQNLSEDQTTDQLTAAKVKRMGETVQNENGFV